MPLLKKIQDTGESPLRGRQEEYWRIHIKPKYERLRPGFLFKMKPQEVLLKEFGIKAFEYGHWTNQNDRLDFLSGAEASLADIKKCTGLSSIGFNKIGIAYGARGLGGRAAAHFEPDTFMINLTKHHGFGSLAHEYGHALDYLFGGYVEPVKESFALSLGRSTATKPDNNYGAGSLRKLMYDVLQAAIFDNNGGYSQSYQRLKKTFAGAEYWFRRNEIFARTFEQYIQIKLHEKKIANLMLTKRKYEDACYLTNVDIIRVYPKMEKLIKAMAAR